MSNKKDKLIEVIRASGYGYFITHKAVDVEDCLKATADSIIANLPELLADSEWVKLPCKVGDIVYVIMYDKIYEAECNYIDINRIGKTWVDLAPTLYPTAHTVYNIQDLNEAWFLTQAEAESKLAELKGATENE